MQTATELTHKRTGDTLRHVEAGLKSGFYRILIPAGTHLWRGAVDTYAFDEPASALLSFDAAPVGPGEPCGADTRNTLARLWDGATLSFYSPARSGSLLMSQPESTSPFRADRDRWLYLQLTFPAGKALNWKSQMDLHAGAVPPQPAAPDLALAQRTLDYANQSGLTEALMAMADTKDEDKLIDWVLKQGDLWFSLCRLAGLAETSAGRALQ